jgi:hypothetical protein
VIVEGVCVLFRTRVRLVTFMEQAMMNIVSRGTAGTPRESTSTV